MAYHSPFDDKSLQIYLSQIGKYPLLLREEEYDLGRNIRLYKDKESLDRLVNANLRFVVSVAKRFIGNGLSLPDLINEGNIGLISAAERFDERIGYRFISYAVWWIKQSMQKALAEQTGGAVKIPVRLQLLFNTMKKYCDNYELSNGSKPSDEHLIEAFLSHKRRGKEILGLFYDSRYGVVSLDEELDEEDTRSRTIGDLRESDLPSPLQELERVQTEELIFSELEKKLDSRRQKILEKHYYDDLNLETIGKGMKVTRERIRQLRNEAQKKLKKSKKLRELMYG